MPCTIGPLLPRVSAHHPPAPGPCLPTPPCRLPLYSLTVQMGSDFKHTMLPKGVREKLLRIAQDVKRKRRAQVAKDGSAHTTVQHIKRGADMVRKRTAELMQLKSGKEGSKEGAGAPEQERE